MQYILHRSVGSRGLGGHGLPDFADIEKRTEAEIDNLSIFYLLGSHYNNHIHTCFSNLYI